MGNSKAFSAASLMTILLSAGPKLIVFLNILKNDSALWNALKDLAAVFDPATTPDVPTMMVHFEKNHSHRLSAVQKAFEYARPEIHQAIHEMDAEHQEDGKRNTTAALDPATLFGIFQQLMPMILSLINLLKRPPATA